MIITEETLRSFTDDLTFRRAKQYYKLGFVEDLDIHIIDMTKHKNEKEISIKANVISLNGFNTYNVIIEWDTVWKRIDGYCTCNYTEEDDKSVGACKHVIAVLLKYIHEYQNEITDSIRETELDNLLYEIKSSSNVSEEYKRELNLEIFFFLHNNYQRPNVELKLGLEKLYVVKGMRNFLKAVTNAQSLEFGKTFTYDPSVHKFNDINADIIEMFLEIFELDAERPYDSYYRGYNNPIISGKKLYLTDKLIYRFFKLARERKLNVIIDNKEFNEVEIINGEMPIKFNLSMKKETIELTQSSEFPRAIDRNNRAFWYSGSIYLPPKAQVDKYVPFHNMLIKNNENKLSFRKREGEKLASYLLPTLKKIAKEVTMDKSIQDNFYEVPLLTKILLDKQDNVVTAAVSLNYNDLEINPLAEGSTVSNDRILIRDVVKEENIDTVLKSFGFTIESSRYVMKNENDIVSFITDGINKLQELGEVYYSDAFKDIKVYGKNNLRGSIRINTEDLLEFSFEMEGVEREELKDIFYALKEKRKYFRLKKGGFVSLEDKGIQDLGEMIEFLDFKDKDFTKDAILLSKYNALYLDQKIKDKDMDYFKRSKNFRELANNIRDIKEMDYSLPEHLDKVMRNYQKIGFKWFKTLSAYGFGGILADEMGLGKTLQTIAFLATEKGERPSLVIAPTSLVYNWQSEIERFAPELRAVVISGSKKQREELMQEIENCDIIITSYPLIRRDIEQYKDIRLNYCILDEAQQIKNPGSINAASVKDIKAKGYFALTGTPMENSLTELWSIFDFIMPGYLLGHSKFVKLYETPIIKSSDEKAMNELNRHIKPFILRRLKKEVIKELPPKIEQKLIVEMSEEQKKLYAAYLESARGEISKEILQKGFNRSKIKILSVLTRLRQICCDPSVFLEDFKGESGKLIALDELIEESVGQGHKILLFSQFTSVLKNISKRLDKSKTKYMYLDGTTKSEERLSMVNEFNEGDSSIFLISLKAGGTGLNLTGADIVIHFDPWWNPAVEDQATDRAHRIGQQKTVEVIKLLAKGTIEEKIFNLQQKKKEVINSVIGEDMNEDNFISQMTQEDLENLFIS